MAKGWLDNYGTKENENNSSVSLPEGFVGMGYDTKGRNYSPAWGGSFQGGGSVYPVNYVPEAQGGMSIPGATGNFYARYQTGGSNISEYKEQEGLERTWDIMSNPLTAFGYVARNEPLPDYFDRGIKSGQIKRDELENTLDLINPIYYANSAARGVRDLIQGEGKELLSEAFNFVPVLKRTQGLGKIAKNSNKIKTLINSLGDLDAFLHSATGKDLISEGGKEQKEKLKKVKKNQTGGSIPGTVGFSYARTQGAAPSNGKYAKKTKASAENGKVIKDDMGQWKYPGEITRISGGKITMKPDPKTGKALTEPLLGIADTGEQQWMYPGEDYNFEGANYVTEIPKRKLAKNGLRQEQKGLQNLDQLTNFTNYNTKQPGGWLNKYN